MLVVSAVVREMVERGTVKREVVWRGGTLGS
jgi:hypothetical protein